MSTIVNCPACGTPASIDPSYYGKKLRCTNDSCRQMFRVQADGSVQMEMTAKSSAPRTVDWQNPPSREAQEGDWLSQPPPRPGGQPVASVVQPVEQMPMASVIPVGAVDTPGSFSSHGSGHYHYGRKKNKFLVILIFLIVLLIGASGFGYWLWQQNIKSGLNDVKKQFSDALDKKRWDEVITKGETLRKQIKDDAEIKDIDFKVSWAQLQQDLTPSQLAKADGIKKATSNIQSFYKTHKGNQTFKPYKKDIAESGFQLVKTASEFLETNPDAAMHDALQPVLELAKEAGNEVPDKDQVKVWMDDAENKFKDARAAIDATLAKKNWQTRMEDVLAKETLGQIDDLQQEYQELTKKHPLLVKDVDLTSKVGNLKTVEPNWVKYSNSNSPPSTNKASFGPSIRICPPVKTPEGVQDDQGIVLAMARGTLYGLSARTGTDRWALRVGQDVRELPPRITLGGEIPDIAFVVTTEDAGQNYLSQMNLITGERNWMRKLASSCPAGPLLISNNRLVVPLKETIAIVEAGTGKMTGFFTISGYDISSQPAHDKARDRLFVPVDRGRIFVLDLATRKCVGVIYTEHGTGQLKGSPVIIDDLLVVCIATGSGTGSTRIRGYDISAKGDKPTFDLIGSYDMPGHASTAPYVEGGDSLGVVSDQGLIWLFGIGKSSSVGTSQSKGNTPFYPLSLKPMSLKLQANTELTKDQPRPRVQVAHVNLDDWWVFSHDYLLRNVYDPFRGIMVPSPMGSLQLGSPLHRAEVSPDARLVVVVTQSKGQAQMMASGIDRTSGKVVWQRQLGTEASQEPVALADTVSMLDRGGAVFSVNAGDVKGTSNWQVCGSWPALPLIAASHRLVKTVNGTALVSLSFDPIRARMIIRRIDLASKNKATVKEFPHTFAPVGSAVALDDGTALVPCKDGNIYQFNFATGASNSLFSWRDPQALPNAMGHLLMPNPNLLIASNGLNKVLRWDRTAQGIWKKVPNDLELTSRIVSTLAPIAGNRVAVGDEAGNLHCLSLAALGTSKQWAVKGHITKGPFRVGAEGVGCIVDGKKLWWINSVDEEEGKVYGGNDVAGIIGEAATIGDDLLIAVLKKDTGLGMLASYAWIETSSGKLVHTERLPEGLAPSSGATPLGKNRAFAPLSDGTVRILIKPDATTAANP